VFGTLLVGFLVWSLGGGYWDGLTFTPLTGLDRLTQIILGVGLLGLAVYLYLIVRRLAGRSVTRSLQRDRSLTGDRDALVRAFAGNRQAWWHSLASSNPRGWTRRTRKQLDAVMAEADRFVQALNDRYARPSGDSQPEPPQS
jgi:hypothetical protein